jgi:hypothetical protein
MFIILVRIVMEFKIRQGSQHDDIYSVSSAGQVAFAMANDSVLATGQLHFREQERVHVLHRCSTCAPGYFRDGTILLIVFKYTLGLGFVSLLNMNMSNR